MEESGWDDNITFPTNKKITKKRIFDYLLMSILRVHKAKIFDKSLTGRKIEIVLLERFILLPKMLLFVCIVRKSKTQRVFSLI